MFWLILIAVTSTGAVGVDHIEFDTEKHCTDAIQTLTAAGRRDAVTYRAFCTEK